MQRTLKKRVGWVRETRTVVCIVVSEQNCKSWCFFFALSSKMNKNTWQKCLEKNMISRSSETFNQFMINTSLF